jgi:serine/threonine protein kinase/Tol biopolymer transport system component
MPLESGSFLGPYKILASLGAGGMGEVYKALDTRLDRIVAIKIPAPHLMRDTEWIARFEREARVLASLNHPNIAAIYGIEQAGDTRALVLEYVEGPTLAESILHGPVPLEEMVPIARQIADALEAAHEKGVIHRDIKPSNVKVTPEGTVKVLDFGLAKSLPAQLVPGNHDNESTVTAGPTVAGAILGTPPYMSPEQARGKSVDRRGDIWAFGCLLFEMLSGRRAFRGESISDTLASVIKDDPDFEAIPAATPARVVDLVRRCLCKEPRQRLRDMGEARLVFEQTPSGVHEPPASAVRKTGLRLRERILWTSALVLAAAAGFLSWYFRPAPQAKLRKSMFTVKFASNEERPSLDMSGGRILYTGEGRLWVRDFSQLEARALPGTERAVSPAWSPNGHEVIFYADGRIWKLPLDGGGNRTAIASTQPVLRSGGLVWTPDDRIIFSTGTSGLLEVPAAGGELRVLLSPQAERGEGDMHHPTLLPEGRGILFVTHTAKGPDTLSILSDGSRKDILQLEGELIWAPVYSPSGHILFALGKKRQGLWAVRFSLASLAVSGEPFLVAADGNSPSASQNGSLAFVSGASEGTFQLSSVNREGKLLADEVTAEVGQTLTQPAISPDGHRIAAIRTEGGNPDLWVFHPARQSKTRLTFTAEEERTPCWSPGGDWIAYLCSKSICVKPADGSGQATVLVKQANALHDISQDGKTLLYSSQSSGKDELWEVSLIGAGIPSPGETKRLLISWSGQLRGAGFSPDRRYLSYSTFNSEGITEAMITSYPDGQGKWQVSSGSVPHFSWDGREIVYIDSKQDLMVVPFASGPPPVIGSPKRILSLDSIGTISPYGMDVSPNGQKFLLVRQKSAAAADRQIILVENWFTEFGKNK